MTSRSDGPDVVARAPVKGRKIDPLVALLSGLPDAGVLHDQLEASARRDSIQRKTPRRRGPRVGSGQYGTVVKHGRYWRLQYRGEPDAKGRRKQHSLTLGERSVMTYDQARAYADLRIAKIAARRIAPGSTCSWPDWCDRVLTVYLPNQRHGSRRTVASIMRRHVRPAFQSLQLHEIRVAHVQTWIAGMRSAGYAPQTIRGHYSVLRWVLRRARAEGLAVEVPARIDIDLPRDDKPRAHRRRREYSTDELRRILAASKAPERTLWMLCAFCGLRLGEGLGLRRCDLELDVGRLLIVRQAAGRREVAPKTEASIAERQIPPSLLAHLREFCAGMGATDLLFPSSRGGMRDASGVRRRHLKPLLRRLGIEGRSSHAFRHWFGSAGAQAGVPMATLQHAMRHRDVRATQRYIAVTTVAVDQAIELIESRYLAATAEIPPERNGESPGESS